MTDLCKTCTHEAGLWGDPIPDTQFCRNCCHSVKTVDNYSPKVGVENERIEYERLRRKFEGR